MAPKLPGQVLYILLIVLLLLSTNLLIVQGRSTKDAPPVITGLSPATIGDPKSYIVVAKSAVNEENRLRCVATNVDYIYWRYKPTLDAAYEDIPSVMEELPFNNGTQSDRVLTDIKSQRSPDRSKINGYYQCFAKSNFIGNEYQTLTPPILLLYAAVLETARIGAEDVYELYGGTQPTAGKPYRLPCIRDPSLNQGGFKLNPPDAANLQQTRVTFQWAIRDYNTNDEVDIDLESAKYKGRVRLDPRTGDLYFAELTADDARRKDQQSVYQCTVLVGFQKGVITNELYLTVSTNSGSRTSLSVEYPVADADEKVTCVEKTKCRLTAIFGGYSSVNAVPEVIQPDGSQVTYNREPYGVSFESGTTENSGDWVFKVTDPDDGTTKTVTLDVEVLAYPKLQVRTNFPPKRIVFTGDRVHYECAPEHTSSFGVSFYINGQEVTETRPSYVTYDKSQPTMFSIESVRRNESASIACIATNDAGTMFELADLTVFDKPEAELSPTEPQVIAGDNNTALFNCSFVLDPKTDLSSVKLWWKSNRTKVADRNITAPDDEGVDAVDTSLYDFTEHRIESRLLVIANGLTQEHVGNTQWWCECSYTVLDKQVPLAKTSKGWVKFATKPPPPPQPQEKFKYTFVIVGAILGLLFLILLVILINCYVQKNKGEQYRVDENERKAGHNPEEEMKAYGYVDYNRPDQNPVKGSRASMNFSERPLESDHGSMDEYGDIDTGRFNEDGSFIGEYRGQNNHRNQADV